MLLKTECINFRVQKPPYPDPSLPFMHVKLRLEVAVAAFRKNVEGVCLNIHNNKAKSS